MRFLIKIPIPLPAENAVVDDPKVNDRLRDIFLSLGAKANYSRIEQGRRVDYVLVDLEPEGITAAAEPVFRLLNVKPEFLPEVVPTPYYGRSGY